MKQILTTLCLLALGAMTMSGKSTDEFSRVFADSTIRLDYMMSGTKAEPAVALMRTYRLDGWAGRRHNMDRLPLAGNTQLTVTEPASGDTLYRTSMSSLYQEWLETGDSVSRAFQNTVLMPMPRQAVDVELTVFDSRHRKRAGHRHRLEPADILIARPRATRHDTVMIHTGSSAGNKIQVAILPEGFTADSMARFTDYTREAVDALLAHEPFGKLRDRFDFIAVLVPSEDEGVSVPLKGEWRNTSFGSHFSTFYSDRYLTSPEVFAMHDALAHVPYEHIIVLANTDTYGGGGIYNSYTLTAAGNALFRPVVVHEFGHSFGGLGDEYFYDNDVMSDTYPTDVEPWEPNITTLVDFKGKWEGLLAPDTPVPTPVADAKKYPVGLYEGAAYSSKGIYRPADVCRMRVNDVEAFCGACQQALERLIDFYTEPAQE